MSQALIDAIAAGIEDQCNDDALLNQWSGEHDEQLAAKSLAEQNPGANPREARHWWYELEGDTLEAFAQVDRVTVSRGRFVDAAPESH